MTEAELEREQRSNMAIEDAPSRPQSGATYKIHTLLADGIGRTVGEIARATGLTTRDVNQIVCKIVALKDGWLRREGKGPKQGGTGYVYFLIPTKGRP